MRSYSLFVDSELSAADVALEQLMSIEDFCFKML